MLPTEGPPPPETWLATELELIALVPEGLEVTDELQDAAERSLGALVVRRGGRIAAEIQHGSFLLRPEGQLLEDGHSLGLAENVVVQCAFGDVVLGAGLGEAQSLRYDSGDCFLKLIGVPCGCFRCFRFGFWRRENGIGLSLRKPDIIIVYLKAHRMKQMYGRLSKIC